LRLSSPFEQKEENMSTFWSHLAHRAGTLGAFAAVIMYVGVAAAYAQETTPSSANLGRIEFNHPGAAKATVEVDLTRDMFSDMFGIGDAALAGMAEALGQSPQAKEGSEAIQQAAAQAAAMRELVGIAKNVINEVRVRVYEDLQSDSAENGGVIAHYDQQLQAGGWDQAVRVQDGDQAVRVSAMRANGAIKGLFVIAADGSDLVLVNVTCDISPENAKQLAATAVKSGLQAGLDKQIEKALKHAK
jgi:Domain of unknown function (DUF4252)